MNGPVAHSASSRGRLTPNPVCALASAAKKLSIQKRRTRSELAVSPVGKRFPRSAEVAEIAECLYLRVRLTALLGLGKESLEAHDSIRNGFRRLIVRNQGLGYGRFIEHVPLLRGTNCTS